MENTALVHQARKKNSRWRKWAILCSIIAVFALWRFFVSSSSEEVLEEESFHFTARDTISIGFDADGKIESKESIGLFFEQNGTVEKVLVQEGELVQEGDILATIKNTELAFEVEKSRIALESSKANLNKTLEGSTKEELTIAQNNIVSAELEAQNSAKKNEIAIEKARIAVQEAENNWHLAKKSLKNNTIEDDIDTSTASLGIALAKENLDLAQKNKEKELQESMQKIDQEKGALQNTYTASRSSIDSAIKEASSILEKNGQEGYGLGYLFSSRDSQLRRDIENEYSQLQEKIESHSPIVKSETIIADTKKYIALLEDIQRYMADISRGLDNTVTSNSISSSYLLGIKSSVLQQEQGINTQIERLESHIRAIENLELTKERQLLANNNAIANAEKAVNDANASTKKLSSTQDVDNFQKTNALSSAKSAYQKAVLELQRAEEDAFIVNDLMNTKIEIARQQYENLKSTPRNTDIAILEQQIESARVELNQKEYRYSQSFLRAPFSGVVIQSNIEAGEQVYANQNAPHMIIRSNSGFVFVANIEEAEIGRVKEKQKVNIYFDALEDVFIDGVVSHISPFGNTDANGVVTYEVTVDIKNPNSAGIKEGMTAYGTFFVSQSVDTITIPLSAMQNDEAGTFVILKTGEKRYIKTGLTDGKMVEVLSGLEELEAIEVKQ